jgi:hypothetical protein
MSFNNYQAYPRRDNFHNQPFHYDQGYHNQPYYPRRKHSGPHYDSYNPGYNRGYQGPRGYKPRRRSYYRPNWQAPRHHRQEKLAFEDFSTVASSAEQGSRSEPDGIEAGFAVIVEGERVLDTEDSLFGEEEKNCKEFGFAAAKGLKPPDVKDITPPVFF